MHIILCVRGCTPCNAGFFSLPSPNLTHCPAHLTDPTMITYIWWRRECDSQVEQITKTMRTLRRCSQRLNDGYHAPWWRMPPVRNEDGNKNVMITTTTLLIYPRLWQDQYHEDAITTNKSTWWRRPPRLDDYYENYVMSVKTPFLWMLSRRRRWIKLRWSDEDNSKTQWLWKQRSDD